MFGSPTIRDTYLKGLSKGLSHSNLHLKVGYVGQDGTRRIYNWDSMVDKYHDILYPLMYKIELTEKELEKYKFQPRMFCNDFYSNPDLWSVLLRMNNMLTSTDFNRAVFMALGPQFTRTLSEILTIEYDILNESALNAKTN